MTIVARTNLALGFLLAVLIRRVYQRFISPQLRSGRRFRVLCRFHPSCSEYGALSLQKHGVVPGLARTFDRLRRCRPDNFDDCFDLP